MTDIDPQELVTDQELTALRVLQLMLCIGAVIYLLVVVGLSVSGQATGEPVDLSLLQVLSLTHVGVTLGALAAAVLVPRLLLSAGGAAKATPRALMARLRFGVVVRSVVLEGASLLGTTVCLIAVISGMAGDHPWVWLNSLSTVVLVVATVLCLVSRQRLVETLRGVSRR
jgi:hypothetical protein